jgi:hypothetical protein
MTQIADSLYSSRSHNARAVDNPKTPDPIMRIRAGIPLSDDMMKRSDRRKQLINEQRELTDTKTGIENK